MKSSLLALVLILKFLTNNVDISEAGYDAHDQPDNFEEIAGAEIIIQQITYEAADKDGKHQGHADGAGPIAPGKQLFQKFFSVFFQRPPAGLKLRRK
jgi:hypothetical protein